MALTRRLVAAPIILAALALLAANPSGAAWPTVQQQPEYVTLSGSNGANDQIPHGIPSTWKQYGGSVPGWNNTPGAGYDLTSVYGQLYTPATGNPQPAVKVEICQLQEWILDGSDVWHAMYSPSTQPVGGAWYPEAFNGPAVGTTIDRSVPGCIIVGMKPGYLYHAFYNVGRPTVNPASTRGVVGAATVRLYPGSYDPSGPTPNLIYDTGVDFWNTPSGGFAHTSGESRFKTLGTSWRTFTYSDLTADQLHAGLLPPMVFDPASMF